MTRVSLIAISATIALNPLHDCNAAESCVAKSTAAMTTENVNRQQKGLESELAIKTVELQSLKTQASEVKKKLGEALLTSGEQSSAQSVQLLKDLVAQLETIQKSLDRIESEIAGISAQIKGQPKPPANIERDVQDLKNTKLSTYLQVQYRDTNQVGSSADAFSVRRMRMGVQHQVDPSTSIKVSYELASGTNGNAAQLKDAQVQYSIPGMSKTNQIDVRAGQFAADLGYDLVRSSGDRELPEYVTYNRVLFSGEVIRGVQVKKQFGAQVSGSIGAANALATDDPEQRTVAPGQGSKLALMGGLRWLIGKSNFGVSGFFGERAPVTTTRTVSGSTVTLVHPEVRRELVYVDGTVPGFLDPNLTLRFEAVTGRDRVPVTPGTNSSITTVQVGNPIFGHNIMLNYKLTGEDHLTLRFDQWDPNLNGNQDVVSTWGVGWSHFLNPKTRVTLSQEWISDSSRVSLSQVNYRITTLRAVVKF